MPRLNPPVEGETRQAHYRRIAQFRVNEVLKRFEQMQSFINREYEYDEDDLKKMFLALEEGLETLRVVLYSKVNKGGAKKFIL